MGRIPKSYSGSLRTEGLVGARVGALTRFFQGDPEVLAVVRQALDEMRRQGAEVVEVAIPDLEVQEAANVPRDHDVGRPGLRLTAEERRA